MNDTFALEGDGPIPDCQVTISFDGGLANFYVKFDKDDDSASVALPSNLSHSDLMIAYGVFVGIAEEVGKSLNAEARAMQ